jgi:hypothetical protein
LTKVQRGVWLPFAHAQATGSWPGTKQASDLSLAATGRRFFARACLPGIVFALIA